MQNNMKLTQEQYEKVLVAHFILGVNHVMLKYGVAQKAAVEDVNAVLAEDAGFRVIPKYASPGAITGGTVEYV